MQMVTSRWLLVVLLLLGVCLLTAHGKGGRGGGGSRGGSRGSSSRGSSSSSSSRNRGTDYNRGRDSSRPAPAPAPAPAPPPAPKPAPRPSAPQEHVVVRQPASNPNFKETNPVQSQPAYNPNYKPPGGPPPPYSPAGQSAPHAPGGAPPPYGQPGHGPAPQYPGQSGVQPPPYPGPAARPPGYPGLPGQNPSYPVQPNAPGQQYGNRPYPVQPNAPNQPYGNRPYPVQPNAPNQPYGNRPYPVQPNAPNQPYGNRPYPVQPGSYPGGYRPGGQAPYPQQPLGGNVWRPNSNVPPPPYMNYGGIPTGANMQSQPHKQKGFLGSLMSMGKPKQKAYKYHGSYPSPYGVGRGGMGGMGAMGGAMGGGFLGKHGRSAAMYTILPYMAMKTGSQLFRPRFGFMPFYMPYYHHSYMPYYHHHHMYRGSGYGYGSEMPSELAPYYDVYDMQYVGKCQRPIKHESMEIKCNSTFEDTFCRAKCQEGYAFADNSSTKANKCWHVTGVWRPTKNFPKCEPVCEEGCLHGGSCAHPGRCKCPPEYRGDRCQFRKSNFLNCDIRKIGKDPHLGWICNHGKNESSCKVRCKDPAEFEEPPADEYKCSLEGKWTPDKIPRCTVKEEKKDEEKKDEEKKT